MAGDLRLEELPILVLDCQATGASPAKGHLLEVGWSRTSAVSARRARVATRLVELPAGASIPTRVRRLTGISEQDTEGGASLAALWTEILAAASDTRTAVMHFSSYEMPYLREMHRQGSATGAAFPFRVLCTHKIAKRLFPTLPRHSLRALAGYFGNTVPELRRAAHHVAATASVWSSLVERLRNDLAVTSLEELVAWLSLPASRPARPAVRGYPMHEALRRGLPRKPGVYRMLRSNGDVLYVGKATSLRDRVASYFRASARHPEHILEMLSQARGLETNVSGSVLEAALHEADEIKKLSPPYNKALRARNRTLVYMDGDLTNLSSTPDPAFRLGPLPGSRLLEAFISIRRLSRGEDVAVAKVMASDERWLPDERTFRRGLALFRERLGCTGLLGRGAALWSVESPDEERDEAELRLEVQYDDGARWRSPEKIAESLDHALRRVSHLVRRAHWLSLLSESAVAWETREGGRRALVLDQGRVVARSPLSPAEAIPEPPGCDRTYSERRDGFDIERYDRLIVLNRELRRLVCEDRWVTLSIGHGSTLDRTRLGRIFTWI